MYFENLEVDLPTVKELKKYTEKFSRICDEMSLPVCRYWWVWSKQGQAVCLDYANTSEHYPTFEDDGTAIPLLRLTYEKGTVISDSGLYVQLFNKSWAVFAISPTEAIAFCIDFGKQGNPPIENVNHKMAEKAVKDWFTALVASYMEE